MTKDRWGDIKEMISERFEVADSKIEDTDPGTLETVEFKGPIGLMRMTFSVKPKLLETKGHGSRRIGSDVAIEHVYDEENEVCTLKVYKYDDDQETWQEIGADAVANL